jgi:hypothetical protein
MQNGYIVLTTQRIIWVEAAAANAAFTGDGDSSAGSRPSGLSCALPAHAVCSYTRRRSVTGWLHGRHDTAQTQGWGGQGVQEFASGDTLALCAVQTGSGRWNISNASCRVTNFMSRDLHSMNVELTLRGPLLPCIPRHHLFLLQHPELWWVQGAAPPGGVR